MSSAPEAPGPPEPTPIRPARTRQHPASVPRPLTSFVGRERETDALVALLTDSRTRLVTLTGPGGVGKTRLAIHLADAAGREYPGGAWFVSCAAIQDPELVAGAIAKVIAPATVGQQTAEEQVIAALQSSRALLVVDNLEHLPGAVPLIGRLLSACPTATILATSRAQLQVSGERVVAVPPLDVPAAGSGCLAEHAAVRLFIERAADLSPNLTPETLDAIVAICHRLDGLPLAIELAAAWTGVLPPAQLLDRLSARLPMLTGGTRDMPARHQTMRDSIAWSYDLLAPDEQMVFRRAGVFAGGFCLEAIEEVATGAGGRAEVLGHVRSLAEKSLIRPVPVAGVPRYQMLETIREFALAQLIEEGEEEVARDTHANWCAEFAERFGAEVTGPDLATWTEWAEAELDNVRSALSHAEARGDGATAVRLAGGIGWLWMYPGRLHEGRAVLARARAMSGADAVPKAFVSALMCAGGIENWLEDFAAGRHLYERALTVCQAEGDDYLAAVALRGIGAASIYTGELRQARDLLTMSRQWAIEARLAWDVAFATHLIGVVSIANGDLVEARSCQEEALAAFRQMGDREYTANVLEAIGWVALLTGDQESARAAFLEMLGLSAANDRWCLARALRGLGAVAEDRDPRRAARLLAVAEREFAAIGTWHRVPVEASYIDIRERIRASLGKEAYAEEWALGAGMPLDEAVAEARIVTVKRVDPIAVRFGLTRRETEVLRLITDGLTDQQIADRLFISRRTASKHVESILAKLNVDSRRAAASLLA
jgi:non-specific serine/threonine protein kinase